MASGPCEDGESEDRAVAIDPQRIGAMATHFMERLEEKYGDEADIEALLFVAAVDTPGQSTVEFSASDENGDGLAPWKVKGMMATVDKAI